MTSQIEPPAISPVRILVVDDHPATAQTLSRAIAQLGTNIDVISATSGKAALEKVQDGMVDLLITDMMMPEMNGLELIENLRAHPAGQPAYTILITAYEVPGLRESARRLKVNETIIKPVRPEHICQVVGRAIGSITNARPASAAADVQPVFKILIADDVPENVSLLARYLQSEGYSYITAVDGLDALEKTRSSMPDLILLDVNMPRMDGFKVLEEIRSDAAIKHIPVIILTAARLAYGDLHSGLNLGADDYITKPFDRRELLARIRTRLRVKEADDLLRRRNRELGLLPEIGRELSARTDMNELMDLVLKRTVETLGAMRGNLILLDTKAPLHKQYSHPDGVASASPIKLPPLNDFLHQIQESRQGLIISNTSLEPRWQMSESDPTRSVVMIPMFGRFDLVGLLVLHHERADYFTDDHRLLLQAICSQAAIAMENAQLYTRVAREQRQLAAILQSAADAILVFDSNGCLSLVNSAAEKLFTDYEVRIGLPLVRGSGYDPLLQLLEDAYTSGQPITGDVWWPDRRFFSALLTPVHEGGCVVVMNDVSRFKTLERVKDEFISTASHDLKNPIATILGFSQILSKAGPLNETQLDFTNRIQTAASHMSELVQDLLQLAKVDANLELKRETVDINSLAGEIADEYKLQAQTKQQVLDFCPDESQPSIVADPFQLMQALRNLVGNAIKYTPEAGTIQLRVETNQQQVLLHVTDSGYGIPAQDLPHIFDRFYRVRHESTKDIEGNGLGLAIAKSIIEKHGGQICVQSELGTGSSFMIALPLLQAPVVIKATHDSKLHV